MNVWARLYAKEMLELRRSLKWLWVPAVFVLLGMMQPVSSYYMPQILDVAGGLPEGTVIEIPPPTGEAVLVETLSNFGTIGLLVLVLAFMGVVSGERNSGAAVLVLVRPVPFPSYIAAKWAALLALTWAALALGIGAAWYYTDMLIGPVAAGRVVAAALAYALWLSLAGSAVVFFSAALRSPGAAAFLTLLSLIALSVLTGLLRSWMEWSPAQLPAQAAAMLAEGRWLPSLGWNIAAAGAGIALLLAGAVAAMKRQPWRSA